jgi:hypothetical protein
LSAIIFITPDRHREEHSTVETIQIVVRTEVQGSRIQLVGHESLGAVSE